MNNEPAAAPPPRPASEFIVVRLIRGFAPHAMIAFGTWPTRAKAKNAIRVQLEAAHLDTNKYRYEVVRLVLTVRERSTPTPSTSDD